MNCNTCKNSYNRYDLTGCHYTGALYRIPGRCKYYQRDWIKTVKTLNGLIRFG